MPDPDSAVSTQRVDAGALVDATTQFLHTVCDEQPAHARALFAEHPDIGTSSLHAAAAVGDVALVETMLRESPSLATTPSDADGTPPIVYAVCAPVLEDDVYAVPTADMRSLRITRLMLDAGADANSVRVLPSDPDVRLPVLYFACIMDRPAVAALLLARGANPNDGESVYHAAERDHRACLDTLVSHGADISGAHEHWGNTPLYFLAGHAETSAYFASAQRGMAWLLAHGANPNVPSVPTPSGAGCEFAEAPLHRVAAFGPVETARLLVTHGAHVDAARGDGRTPLALATRLGNGAVTDYLVSAGANPGRVSVLDRFTGACARGDEPVARAYLDADPSLPDQLTADERGALTHVIAQNRVDAVVLMLSMGWSLADEDGWAGTPLHHAAWHGRPEIVRVLLERGAPVDVHDRVFGSSPLAWAAHGMSNGRVGADADYAAVTTYLRDAGAAA